MVESVDLGSQSPESDNDLSVTIRGAGLEAQEGVTVYAQITDSNGIHVWPTDQSFNFFEIPSDFDPDDNGINGLEKGQTFTVDGGMSIVAPTPTHHVPGTSNMSEDEVESLRT